MTTIRLLWQIADAVQKGLELIVLVSVQQGRTRLTRLRNELYSDSFHAVLAWSCGRAKCQFCTATVTVVVYKNRKVWIRKNQSLKKTRNHKVAHRATLALNNSKPFCHYRKFESFRFVIDPPAERFLLAFDFELIIFATHYFLFWEDADSSYCSTFVNGARIPRGENYYNNFNLHDFEEHSKFPRFSQKDAG